MVAQKSQLQQAKAVKGASQEPRKESGVMKSPTSDRGPGRPLEGARAWVALFEAYGNREGFARETGISYPTLGRYQAGGPVPLPIRKLIGFYAAAKGLANPVSDESGWDD